MSAGFAGRSHDKDLHSYGEGQGYKFTIVKDKSNKSQLPKVGAIVEVTYTGTLGGAEPAQVTTIKSTTSNIHHTER